MKAYTDIEQSKKLAKILPLESADMFLALDGTLPMMSKYIDDGFVPADNTAIPCWSHAALLDILPHRIDDRYEVVMGKLSDIGGWYVMYMYDNVDDDVEHHAKYRVIHSNPIDACYEMILKLHEQNLL